MFDSISVSVPNEISASTAPARACAIGYVRDDLIAGMSAILARLDHCRRAASHSGFEIPDNLCFYDRVVASMERTGGWRRMWAAIKRAGIKHVYCCEKDLSYQRCRIVTALMDKAGVTVHWLGDRFDPLAAELDESSRDL